MIHLTGDFYDSQAHGYVRVETAQSRVENPLTAGGSHSKIAGLDYRDMTLLFEGNCVHGQR